MLGDECEKCRESDVSRGLGVREEVRVSTGWEDATIVVSNLTCRDGADLKERDTGSICSTSKEEGQEAFIWVPAR